MSVAFVRMREVMRSASKAYSGRIADTILLEFQMINSLPSNVFVLAPNSFKEWQQFVARAALEGVEVLLHNNSVYLRFDGEKTEECEGTVALPECNSRFSGDTATRSRKLVYDALPS